MISFTDPYLYAKGTCNVVVADPATKKIDYQSNKVATNQFTTSCDLGEIRAGFGNPLAIQIPQNCAVNLTLTTQDFSMATRAMQLGSSTYYNAVSPICEAITATTATLTVSMTPVACQGFTDIFCYIAESGAQSTIGTNGIAYTINPTTKNIQGFTATANKTYLVHYWYQNASAQGLTVNTMFAPSIKHVTAQIGVFSSYGAASASQGTQVGWLYYIIPRMQFTGKGDITGDQTANVTSELSGTALPYDAAVTSGSCTDCATPEMAYMVYVPLAGATSAVEDLIIAGGSVSVAVNGSIQTPVKYLMPDGTVVQPVYTDLTYAITDTTKATVSSSGVITGVAAGDTEITVSLASPALSTVANVTVTSA